MYALGLAEHILNGRGALRIHGGGFGGTIQAFVPVDMVDDFMARMDAWLGEGSCALRHLQERCIRRLAVAQIPQGNTMTDMNTLTPTPEACAQTIQSLVDYCATRGLIGWADRVWAYNTVLDCVAAPGPAPATEWVLADKPHTSVLNPSPTDDYDLEAALALISEVAVAHGAAEDTASGRDRIAMRVMGELMPRPSEVATEFRGRLDVGERHAATDWFYRMCCDCGYVRHAAIARNIASGGTHAVGRLEITINLSKPEKDPREIAAAGAAKNTGEVYPACQLCIENEGYPGRSAASGSAHPARQNLRIVPIELGGERWCFNTAPMRTSTSTASP